MPASAHAFHGLPGPSDVAKDILQWTLETFFGIRADAVTRVLKWLIAFPLYTNDASYAELNDLRVYVTAGAWGIFTLVFTASCARYWAAGFTASSTYAALEAMGRSAASAGARGLSNDLRARASGRQPTAATIRVSFSGGSAVAVSATSTPSARRK